MITRGAGQISGCNLAVTTLFTTPPHVGYFSPGVIGMISFVLLISRQGKVRLSKFYEAIPTKERTKLLREVSSLVLNRPAKQCNFIEYKDSKLVYKRFVGALAEEGTPERSTRVVGRPAEEGTTTDHSQRV